MDFFGFFECEDDQEAANGLFNAVLEWFADQGIRCLRGPANPGVNYIWGTLVEGFDSPPTFMMAYNPPYYGRLIEGFGFSKAQDLYAYWGNIDMLPAGDAKRGPIAAQIAERFHIRVRPLEMRRFKQNVRDFLEIYNQSMIHHWGFSPMSPEELDEMVKVLRYLVIPELVVGAEIDGKLVGMVMALPDYNPRIKQIDGKLFPLGFLRLFLGAAQDQESPRFGGQRASRVSPHGRGACPAASHGPDGDRPGDGRSGVLLGGRIEPAFARKPGKGGHEAHQDLSRVRSRTFVVKRPSRSSGKQVRFTFCSAPAGA